MENLEKENLEKEFVPYKLTLALKELGFNEPCFGYRDGIGHLMIKGTPHCAISAPTFSQAFRFFREKYGDYLLYSFGVIPHFTIIQNLIIEDSKITYEEAELECLKKLIEIVKNK